MGTKPQFSLWRGMGGGDEGGGLAQFTSTREVLSFISKLFGKNGREVNYIYLSLFGCGENGR